jgi:toxin-antitoxin system PIN domain toxin
MILLDANILLYAYNSSFERHESARSWLETTLTQQEPIRLSWLGILAFVRIATNPRAFEQPLSTDEACSAVSSWLSWPSVAILEPGEKHWEILQAILETHQLRGPIVTDAHIAALAIEHGARLCTSDGDFARFEGLKLMNPFRMPG